MTTTNKKDTTTIVWLLVTTCLAALALTLSREELFLSVTPFIWSISLVGGFCLYEAISLSVVNKQIETSRPQQVVNLYMALKGAKIMLFLLAVVIYAIVVKIELKRFILVAVAVYFVYLLLDTLFLSNIEKRKKAHETE